MLIWALGMLKWHERILHARLMLHQLRNHSKSPSVFRLSFSDLVMDPNCKTLSPLAHREFTDLAKLEKSPSLLLIPNEIEHDGILRRCKPIPEVDSPLARYGCGFKPPDPWGRTPRMAPSGSYGSSWVSKESSSFPGISSYSMNPAI